eukprot:4120909-Pleurochrysis_carterae.AAC.4
MRRANSATERGEREAAWHAGRGGRVRRGDERSCMKEREGCEEAGERVWERMGRRGGCFAWREIRHACPSGLR